MKLRKGEQWGALTCRNVFIKRITQEDGSTITVSFNTLVYALECQCGKIVETIEREFPGKKQMTDCGCGAARHEHKAEGHIAKAVSLPDSVHAYILADMASNGSKFSGVLARLASIGIEVERRAKAQREEQSA